MDKSQKVFMDYIIALQHKQYDKVIKILTDLVNEIDPNEEQLIDCIKCHTGAFFRYEKYDGVMEDCRKLRLLKYNIEEDQDTAAMESIGTRENSLQRKK